VSDVELKELVASLGREHRETERTLAKLAEERAENDHALQARLAKLAEERAESAHALEARLAKLAEERAESDRALKARLAKLAEQWAETKQMLAAESAATKQLLAAESAETDRHLRRLEGSVGMQFGRFVEALVEPSCLKLFQQRGIVVNQSMRRVEALVEGQQLEIDVLLVNGSDVVLVEIKSACRVPDVADVLEDLKRFRKGFPLYASHTLYGAVAALEYRAASARYAARKGLFVLRSAGGLMEIANPLNFRAKKF
jgi:hypothetical protein